MGNQTVKTEQSVATADIKNPKWKCPRCTFEQAEFNTQCELCGYTNLRYVTKPQYQRPNLDGKRQTFAPKNYWAKKASYPNQSTRSNLISINKDEYIVGSDIELCKYNIRDNKWHSSVSYPKGFNKFECCGSSNIAYDPKRNYVYIFNHDSVLLKINIDIKYNSLNYDIIKAVTIPKNNNSSNCMIFANDHLHLIAGKLPMKYYILNEKTQRFKQKYVFKQYSTESNSNCMIYLQSYNKLLFFVWNSIYSLDLNNNHNMNKRKLKWDKLSLKLPESMYDITCVVSEDEKYLIICGCNSRKLYDVNRYKIYIMEIKTYRFKKCQVKQPKDIGNGMKFVLMNNGASNQILICGYLRNIWRLFKNNNTRFISNDCIKLIQSLYGDGDIYAIDQLGSHHTIKFNDLMSTL